MPFPSTLSPPNIIETNGIQLSYLACGTQHLVPFGSHTYNPYSSDANHTRLQYLALGFNEQRNSRIHASARLPAFPRTA
jgi:hypothetical protein